MKAPVVLKFGGELLEDSARMNGVVASIAKIAATGIPIAVVHGGGKEIDAALKVAGIEKRQIEGLRITDEATLEVVVSVLAGIVNTRFVAALTAAGVSAVGLTGADGGCGIADVAPPHRTVDGRSVELGRVGLPSRAARPALPQTLMNGGFVPVMCSIGATKDGQLLNVNADTMAGYLAGALKARRLIVAGSTAGVLDGAGKTVAVLDPAAIAALVGSGTATAGMIAKLRACEDALAAGVEDVVIVDGRDGDALCATASGAVPAAATRIVTTVGTR
ncbi:MAG TPA: acetylglutamate kinase [Vicinamibacterales bacterium]|nr:acetylglutamate kinase [Vicinamibacterales bacterium]